MAVVLTILKIIGIILLVLLALALLLIILVLAVPIRYKVKGGYTAENIEADVNVRWLIFRVLANFKKDEGLIVKAKVLFVTVKTIKKDIGKKDDVTVEQDVSPGDIGEEALSGDVVDSNGHLLGSAGDTPSDGEPLTQEDAEVFGDGKPEETGKKKKEKKKKEKKKDKKKSEEEPAETVPAAVLDEEEGEAPPKEGPLDKLEAIRDKVETKKRHIECFFAKDFVKRTIERGKKLLIKFFKHLKPTKGHVDLTMGLGSAADTGMMLGKLGMFYPLYGKWLFITPDFYYKRIEAEGDVKGRIRIGSLVLPALFFYLKKDTRRTIRLAKKI